MSKHNIKMKKIISLLIIILLLMGYISPTYAAGGAYTLDWTAADPAEDKGPYSPTYEKVPPDYLHYDYPLLGRQSDPLEDAIFWEPDSASNKDAVESLAPKDLVLGQIVPFELEISVSGDTGPEDGVIHVNPYFNTKTTSGDDFGYDPSYGVIAAFVDTSESHFVDPDGDATVSDLDWEISDAGTKTEKIDATIKVSGLDDGDLVIVEIWVVLKDRIPDKASGNVQTGLDSAQTQDGDVINTGNETVPLLKVQDFLSPSLSIVKTAAEANYDEPGDIIHYTMTVTNTGNIPLTGVMVEDDLLEDEAYSTGDDGNGILDVGETWTYTGTYTVDQDDIDEGQVDNTATADSNETDPVEDSETVYAVQNPALSIVKTAAEANYDEPDDVIHYTMTVTNTGNIPLTGVMVEDDLLEDEAYSSGDDGNGILDVGETWTYTGTYTVDQGDVDAGQVDNTATADSNETDPVEDSETVYAATSAGLSIVKTAAEANYDEPGDVIHYTMTVTNTGNISLTGLMVEDDLLEDEAYSSGDDGNGILDVGETWTYTGTYTVDQDDIDEGQVDNTATADSNETDPVEDSEMVYAVQNPALSIVKTAAEANYDEPDDVIHYTMTVTNTGNMSLTGIMLEDDLLENEAYSSGDDGNGILDVGETWTYTGTYTVDQDDVDEGQVDNTATADSNETDPDQDSETVYAVQNPMLNLVKTGTFNDEDGDGLADPGETISYSFEVENIGNITLTNVTVTDPLVTVTGEPITLNVGDVDTDTFTGTYTITQDDIDAGKVDNTATADSDESEPYSDEETVGLSQNAMIDLVKTGTFNDEDGDGYADPGETISYSFEVSNIGLGNITLHNVTVTDPKVTVTGGPITLNVGEVDTSTFTGTYTITQADIEAGKVDNTATADSNESEPDEDQETVLLPQNADLDIVKTVDGVEHVTVYPGEEVTYEVTITNIGNITLMIDYSDSDNHDINDTQSFDLTPGGIKTFEYMTSYGAIGTEVNTATAIYYDGDQVPVTESDTASVDIVNVPVYDLEISKTVNGVEEVRVEKNVEVKYEVVLNNTGNQELYIRFWDSDGYDLTEGETEEYFFLDSGTTTERAFYTSYSSTGEYTNNAVAEYYEHIEAYEPMGTVTDSAIVDVYDDPPDNKTYKMKITKEADAEEYEVGDIITYNITLENIGNQTLTDIEVKDPMLDFSKTIGKLPSSGDDSVTFTVEYEATEVGTIKNTVTAIDDRASTVRDDETVVVKDDGDGDSKTPGLDINKEITSDKKADFVPGDIVEFTLTVKNTGETNLDNILVKDEKAGYEYTIEKVLGPGDEVLLTVTMEISEEMVDFDNVATAEVDHLFAEDFKRVTVAKPIVEEESVPLALPQAGIPPMFLFYGFAAIASGLGLTISKKR
ncbi:conserved repeat domain-containing protein [Dethiosulfatibacter aminovorans DSM 17477]|uniref:Conserved repeat domain-containing protein n=1 Tax=Dethiosulfatibacter aminovorans DSM 17477 TaxID=1121476 RepID=A0A1M6G9E5_9FIRM|nr:DUF11 domain-containing protein [Dethiosulfatibacter aminovorans]SHJ06539.1 conserved repeat domain-containing protein [Dethiosulfatibacter aminovorans DSM 17477]